MNRTGVVAALDAEARTLGRTAPRPDGLQTLGNDMLVAVSGMGAARAARAAHALLRGGATRLVSWGLAGGLDPKLRAGTLCLPLSVVSTSGERYTPDEHWSRQMSGALAPPLSIVHGLLLSVPSAVESARDKAALFAATGAAAVDMESAAIAGVAAAMGRPFVALRVVVDTAADSLPPVIAAASVDGEVRLAPLLVGLLRAPHAVAALSRLGVRYAVAMRALRAVARSGALT